MIGCRKMEAVLAALRLGYDVIFSDMDIVYFKDPIKYLFFPDVDYVHSENKGCNVKWNFNETMEGNTGTHSNPRKSRSLFLILTLLQAQVTSFLLLVSITNSSTH